MVTFPYIRHGKHLSQTINLFSYGFHYEFFSQNVCFLSQLLLLDFSSESRKLIHRNAYVKRGYVSNIFSYRINDLQRFFQDMIKIIEISRVEARCNITFKIKNYFDPQKFLRTQKILPSSKVTCFQLKSGFTIVNFKMLNFSNLEW